MDVYEKMKQLGITLPKPPAKGGVYSQIKQFGNGLVYVSGCGPTIGEQIKGKIGKEFTLEQGQGFARNCMLNILAILEANLGDLRKIKKCAKVLTFVACADDFYDHPSVANGGTQLLVDLFGPEIGLPARSAVGANSLPFNIPVETEGLFEIQI